MNQLINQLVIKALSVAWRRRRLMIIPFALVLAAGLLYAKLAPKTYVARSLLLLQEVTRDMPLSRELPNSGRSQDRAVALQALLKSNRVLHAVMTDLAEPEVIANPRLAAAWITGFSKSLSLEPVGNDFLEISLASASPHGLGEQLGIVTLRFFEALLSSNDVLSATQVLLDGMKQKVVEAEAAVAQFQQTSAQVPGSQQAALRDQTAALRVQILAATPELEAQSRAVDAIRRQIQASKSVKRATVSKATSPDPSADDSGAAQAAGGADPALIAALQGAEQSYEAAATNLAALKRRLADAELELQRYAQSTQRLEALQQRAAEARRALEDYSRKFTVPTSNRTIGLLSAPERIKLVDPPRDPEHPQRSAMRIVLMSILASLAAALSFVAIAELLDNTVRNRKEIEDLTGAPVLARLPAV